MLVTATFQSLAPHFSSPHISGMPEMSGNQTDAVYMYIFMKCVISPRMLATDNPTDWRCSAMSFLPMTWMTVLAIRIAKREEGRFQYLYRGFWERGTSLWKSDVAWFGTYFSHFCSLFLSTLLLWILWTPGHALRCLSLCRMLLDLPASRNVR